MITGFALYLSLGMLLGFLIDRSEMKKPVPYGDSPAIIQLSTLRAIVIIAAALVGVPFLLAIIVSIAIDLFQIAVMILYGMGLFGYVILRLCYLIVRHWSELKKENKSRITALRARVKILRMIKEEAENAKNHHS